MKLSNRHGLTQRLCLLSITGLACLAAPVWAADIEASGNGGVHIMDGGVGAHDTFGGQGGFHFGGGFVFGEFNWTQLASTSLNSTSSGVSIAATGTANLANYGGGVDYSLGSSRRVTPYLVTAIGVGHFYAKGSASGGGVSATTSLSISNDIYYGIGGGARIYFGKHWGIKPEFRYQRYDGTLLTANSLITTVSLFWRSGGN